MDSILLFSESLFIKPIVYLISGILNILTSFGFSEGFAIVVLSLIINTLILPLYAFSERLQTKERETRKRLDVVVEKLKTAYKGVTLHFLTQYWYRQQGYRPIYALRSLLGFFIQLPFFLAAYQYLGRWTGLEGKSFFFLKDLSKEDSLLFGLNLLPFIMTALNLVSGFVYGKNLRKQDKVQLLALSLIFFVLLYPMPSGLLLYWTVNNLYSLIKNIFAHWTSLKSFQFNVEIPGLQDLVKNTSVSQSLKQKLSKLEKWLDALVWWAFFVCFAAYVSHFGIYFHKPIHNYLLWICLGLSGFLAFNGGAYFFMKKRSLNNLKSLFAFLLKLALLLASVSLASFILLKMVEGQRNNAFAYSVKIVWFDYVIFLFLLTSSYKYVPIVLNYLHQIFPQNLISSKQRNALFFSASFLLISISSFYSPLSIIYSDAAAFSQEITSGAFNNYLALGVLFFVLLSVFYLSLKKRTSHIFVICLVFLANLFILYSFLPVPHMSVFRMRVEELPELRTLYFASDLLAVVLSFFFVGRFIKLKKLPLLSSLYLLFGVSYIGIALSYQNKNETFLLTGEKKERLVQKKETDPKLENLKIELSPKDNLILIFTDRFYGGYLPLLLKDDPSISSKLEGFTWYANTASYGNETASGMPASLGGYRYETSKWYKEYSDQNVKMTALYTKILPDLLGSLFYNLHRNHYPVALSLDYEEPSCSLLQSRADLDEKIAPDVCLNLEEEMNNKSEAFMKQHREWYYIFSLGLVKTTPYFLKKLLLYHWAEHYSTFSYNAYSRANAVDSACFGIEARNCYSRRLISPLRLELANGKETVVNGFSRPMFPYLALYRLPDKSAVNEKLERQFIFIDSLLPHMPGSLGYDCDPNDASFRKEDETLFQNHALSIQQFYLYKCAIFTLNRWFDFLKKEGIYDKSTILWFSDHGMRNYFDPQNMTSPKQIVTPETNPSERDTVLKGSFNPILLVKPKGSRGLLKISNEVKMNADVVANFLCSELSEPCYNPFLKEPYLKNAPEEDFITVRGTDHSNFVSFYKIPKTGILSAPLHLEKAQTPTK